MENGQGIEAGLPERNLRGAEEIHGADKFTLQIHATRYATRKQKNAVTTAFFNGPGGS